MTKKKWLPCAVIAIFLVVYGYYLILDMKKGAEVILSEGFTKDNLFVYKDAHRIDGADPTTFSVIDKIYSKDRFHVYETSYGIEGGSATAPLGGAEPASFLVLSPVSIFGDVYAKDAVHGFYGGRIILGADGKTFQYVEGGYARDKDALYYGDKRMPNIDFSTLKFIKNETNIVVRDRYAVYDGERLIQDANPITFQLLKINYARDNHSLYYLSLSPGDPTYQAEVLPPVDLPSFEILSSEYAKDRSTVYHHVEFRYETFNSTGTIAIRFPEDSVAGSWRIIPGADSKTLTLPFVKGVDSKFADSAGYAKDIHAVYYNGVLLIGADPATFQLLHNIGYAKDKNHVYLREKTIKNADPATFELVNPQNWITKDKNRTYYSDQPK